MRLKPFHTPGLLLVFLALLPNTLSAGTSTSVKHGAWSDPGTWDVAPCATQDVKINHQVFLDKGEAKRVDVAPGATLLLQGDLDLHGSLVVKGLLSGKKGNLRFHVPNDRLFLGNTVPGPNANDPDDHSGTDTGLWVLDRGKITLEGEEVTPWLDIVPNGTVGVPGPYGTKFLGGVDNNTVTVSKIPVGWKKGDALLLTNLEGKTGKATLTNVTGQVVSFENLDPPTFQTQILGFEDKAIYPKVANLTRRLVIESSLVKEGDFNHRAHTVFMGHITARVRFVEFKNLGTRGKLGRYPVHFHHTHTILEALIQGCSFHQTVSDPGSRFLSIHNTREVEVRDCVGFRCQGHGYFLEQGTEVYNTLVNNLSVDVRGPEELTVRDQSLARGTHHFWLRDANTVEGNVSVGGTAPLGMAFLRHSVKLVPHPDIVTKDNEFHGMAQYGFWHCANPTTFVRAKAAFCASSGNGPRICSDFPAPLVLEKPVFLLNGDPRVSKDYESQVFGGNSDFTINDGTLVGKKIIHIHYRSSFKLNHCKIRGNTLLTPTYWELGGIIQDSNVTIEKLFDGPYPIRRQAPGYLSLNGSTYLQGVAKNVQASGFLQPPPNLPRTAEWSVTPKGQAPKPLRGIGEQRSRWNESTTLGYPEGFEPGTYDVKIVLPDKTTTEFKDVVIKPNTVTSIP